MSAAGKYIELLVQMLAIPAVSKQEETRADFLEFWLRNEGLHVERIQNNLLISAGNDPRAAQVLLNSHMDTVPAGDGWNSDPNLPSRCNGKITALGSNDAGASVVSLIAAFQSAVAQKNQNSIALLISAEEEISGKNGVSLVLPEFQNLKFAIVGEPTRMHPAIAERGLMVVDGLAKGVQGHAARGEGTNAIYLALDDIQQIRDLAFDDHSPWLADPSVNVTVLHGGMKHNVVPGSCEFVIDVRSNDKYSNERLLKMLQEICASKLEPRSMRLRSSSLPADHFIYKLINEMGLKPFGSPTLSDMALMNFPAIKIGPGDSARSHTANEYILEEEIAGAIEIYAEMLARVSKLVD